MGTCKLAQFWGVPPIALVGISVDDTVILSFEPRTR